MVKAIIDVHEHTNKILNIIKAKHGLKDKSKAIDQMAKEYEEKVLELELRPKVLESFKDAEQNRIASFDKEKEEE